MFRYSMKTVIFDNGGTLVDTISIYWDLIDPVTGHRMTSEFYAQ
jgi:phosphoglycolate phosphatase-like HAD superfamily hydrolase